MFRINHIKHRVFIFICFLPVTTPIAAQKNASDYSVKRPVLAIQFLLNDFKTAEQVRKYSIGNVLNHNNWSRMAEMDAGLGLNYLQGLTTHMDISARLDITSLDYFFRSKPMQGYDNALVETDASLRVKMLPDKYFLVPYLTAGAGLSVYKNNIGAYLPLGMGIQLNLGKGDAFVFSDIQYRVPLTANTNFHFNYAVGVAAALVERKEKALLLPIN